MQEDTLWRIFLDIKVTLLFPRTFGIFFDIFISLPYQVSGGFEFRRPIPMRWTTTGHMLCMETRYTSPCINAPHNSSSSYIDIIVEKKTEHHHYHYDVYVCLGLNNTCIYSTQIGDMCVYSRHSDPMLDALLNKLD